MKRQALVSLGLWLIYAVAWYSLLWMGSVPTMVLFVTAIIPSFPMAEWFWGELNWKVGTFWSNLWIWIMRWGFGLFWMAFMGFLMSAPLIEMRLPAYGIPVIWLVFSLMHLGVQWQEEVKWRKYTSA